MSNKKYQVFISSTYTDLRDERQAAVEAILKSGHIPAGMELFSAGDESQLETIKRWIDASDIYLLILGTRYGSLEPKSGLAYIECEYDYAISNQKPFFSIVASKKLIEKKTQQFGAQIIETHLKAYKDFRDKVLSKTSSFFEDCKDIKLGIHESISDIENRYDLTCWVSASEIQDSKSLISNFNSLSEENIKLKQQIVNLEKRLGGLSKGLNNDNSFDELRVLLSKIKIETNVLDKKKSPKTYDILNLFYFGKLRFLNGITNSPNTDALNFMLYQQVCPTLEIHGLVVRERVLNQSYRIFKLTKLGLDLLAYLDKFKYLNKSPQPDV